MKNNLNIIPNVMIQFILKPFPLFGIATKDRFELPNPTDRIKRSPHELMPEFNSVIVFGEGRHKKPTMNHPAQSFEEHFKRLVAPLQVVSYLQSLGYTAHIVHKSNLDVSLVDMAVQAGIGEKSPVNSLVVKNYGLSAVLQAIVTDAPIQPSPLPHPKEHCIQCMKCLHVCPIRQISNAPGDLSQCACNKCVEACPV